MPLPWLSHNGRAGEKSIPHGRWGCSIAQIYCAAGAGIGMRAVATSREGQGAAAARSPWLSGGVWTLCGCELTRIRFGMSWIFDQPPNAACIACRSVIAGEPVMLVTHYDDDHSWAFLDGKTSDTREALVVAMSEVLSAHPELFEIADLPAGWTARRAVVGDPWVKTTDSLPADA